MSEKIITEEDIAAYLLNTPSFFERQAGLLSSVQLTSPHGQRAVSLQERQMELLRERIKGLELRMANMIRAGGENDQLQQKLLDWSLSLLKERIPERLPDLIVKGLQTLFNIPQAALRIWTLSSNFSSSVYAQPVSENVLTFVKGMSGEPYCGPNPDLEVVGWLDQATDIRSVALLPLYDRYPSQTFGLIVLGSTDERRFTSEMGVDMLKSMATIATAALMRCTKV